MSEVSINYKGSSIATMDSSGTKTLLTDGKYCEDDIEVVYARTSGTEGTPTATKGTVSNNSVSVTPSVTNTAGYINGGTHDGTAVTVSASELVSGSETKTANGTYDVTNLASLVVNVATDTIATATATASTTQTLYISFSVSGNPKFFVCYGSPSSSSNNIVTIWGYNGSCSGFHYTGSGGTINQSSYSATYSDGVCTVRSASSANGYFPRRTSYTLIYVY